jgi:hypothetical protein
VALGFGAALGQADQLGEGVGDALDVAAALEVGDDLAGGLLGDVGEGGEVGRMPGTTAFELAD